MGSNIAVGVVMSANPGQQDSEHNGLFIHDKRGGTPAIPEYFRALLSAKQLLALDHIGKYGWELYFIRRIGRNEVLVAVRNSTRKALAVLEKDGRVNLDHNLRLRD